MDIKTLLDTPPWDWPRDAKKIFKKTLLDRRAKPSDRLIAAELAGDLVAINDELADVLLDTVRSADEPDELRARAAISLGPVLEQASVDEFEDPEDVPITEFTFRKIQDTLANLYLDDSIAKQVRRKILEASVRAPEPWHAEAIRTAYRSGDKEWMLTAVFAMRYVRGFDEQILEALNNPDPDIHYEAVEAAGNWALDGAWAHVVALATNAGTPKPLVFAAITAVGTIRPAEARAILGDLVESDDEQIAEVAIDAIEMSEGITEGDDEDDEAGGGKWIN